MMSSRSLVLSLALLLAACAGSATPPPATGEPIPLAAKPHATPAGWAVSIVGTPFALGFKSVVCAASLVVAAPIAGFLALDPDPYDEGLDVLGDGIANNCGPPWVISPYAAS
jgi:hypothetical protein